MKMRRIQIPFEFKAADDGRKVSGYGSVFGNIDAYGDKIAPGAFTESLAEHSQRGTSPAMLYQHNPDWPIGKWTDVGEDDKGLKVTGELADTQQARDVGALLRMGAISGASIGFIPRKWEIDDDTGIRTLTRIELWEVSVVTFPANEAARIESRAAEIADMSISEIEGLLREAGMSRREAKTAVSRILSFGSQRDAVGQKEAAETLLALDRLRRSVCGR